MAEAGNPFSAALAAHEAGELRRAFDTCNQAPGLSRFHRTTLQRWLDGSIPTRGPFIQCLADQLGDPRLYQAWEEARSQPKISDRQAVIDAFESLAEHDRSVAFHEIRKRHLSHFHSVRSRFSMRVNLGDDPDHRDLLRIRVSVNWMGRIPARATVIFVTDQAGLGEAYATSECIFREVIELDASRLDSLLSAGDHQILAYTPLAGDHQAMTRFVGDYAGNGVFQFDNPEVENAQIRLSLSYPFPRGVQTYPVLFGEYQIAGVAEITVAVQSKDITQPRGIAFLPPGERRNWAVDALRDDELVVYAGRPDMILSDGDGVVLSWTEQSVV